MTFSFSLDVWDREAVNTYHVFNTIQHISEYPRAPDRERECPTLFFQGAIFASLLGVSSHLFYKVLKGGDIKNDSSFAMMMMGAYFLASWVTMNWNGTYFASPGFEAGMCMGYEIYAFLMEFVYWYNGRYRPDYMFHHILCMFFSVATRRRYINAGLRP